MIYCRIHHSNCHMQVKEEISFVYVHNPTNTEHNIITIPDIGKKWCSVDKYFAGDRLFCHQTSNSLLLDTSPLKEARKVERKHCYHRGSAPFKSEIFHEFASYINEILSCVHSGQPRIETAVLDSGYDRKLIKSEESCDFLLQRDTIPHYHCFNNPANADDHMKTCYSNKGNLLYCVEQPTGLYMYCIYLVGDLYSNDDIYLRVSQEM